MTHYVVVTKDTQIAPNDGETYRLRVPSNAQARVVEKGEGRFTVDITLEENAQLTYIAFTHEAHATRRAQLAPDARILWAEIALEGGTSTITTCLGEGADARLRSLFLGRDKEKYSISSTMIHEGDKSSSNMLTRSVMFDESSGNYDGLIRIDEHARGCDAYQKEDTLLLSSRARMHAQPNLEIGNEEVKCSHGVSLGKIDREKLFYLTARGIDERMAIRLIVDGFFADVLDAFGDHARDAAALIAQRLEGVHNVA